MMLRRSVWCLLFLAAAVSWAGCLKGGPGKPLAPEVVYLPRTSPENVLRNLETAWKNRDIEEYAKLFAEDFRFYFDEGTRQQNGTLPVFWNAVDESTQIAALFSSPLVTDIRIKLQFGPAKDAGEPGRPGWVYIDVLDTFLEVDLEPEAGELEGLTLRIDGQKQRFFFRKGRTPEDTESEIWYIVEWRDFGNAQAPGRTSEGLLVEPTTWSRIKSLNLK